jgi:hypothetical protein
MNLSFSLKVGLIVGFLIAIDVFNFFENSIFKILPSIFFLVYLIVYFIFKPKLYKTKLKESFWWILLLLIALPGVIINKIIYDSGFFTAIFNIIIMLSIFYTSKNDGINYVKLFHFIYFFCISFVVFAILAILFNLSGELITHEKSFLICPVLLIPFYLRKWLLFLISLFLVLVFINLDPRTTHIINLGIIFILVLVLKLFSIKRVQRLSKFFVFVLFVFSLLFGTIVYDFIRQVNVDYKKSQGADENSYHRELLWLIGFQEFLSSPIYGNYFTGRTSYDPGKTMSGNSEFDMAPLHNDYLEFLTKGGVIGLLIFLAAIISTLSKAFKIIVNNEESEKVRKMLSVLFIVIFTACVTMAYNPVINRTRSNFFFYFFIALVFILREDRNICQTKHQY